jgi:hypothetical protein
VALELVGRAVLARLALDLDDRALALRAARHAVPLLEQLLADLTDPAVGLPGGAVRPAVTLEDLLAGAEDDDVGAPS